MPLTDDQIADIVTAMLTVNQFPLERAAALMPKFRQHGLLSPKAVLEMDQKTIIQRMSDGGYSRGGFLPILSFRLVHLMQAISKGTLNDLAGHISSGNKEAFVESLTAIHGFGPTIAGRAWLLATTQG